MSPETRIVLSHFSEADPKTWRWPNFSPAEIACRGTGKLLINEPALDKLQSLRDRLGDPLIVRSAYRSPEHNRAVGGAPRSKHMDGAAFDITMAKRLSQAPAQSAAFPSREWPRTTTLFGSTSGRVMSQSRIRERPQAHAPIAPGSSSGRCPPVGLPSEPRMLVARPFW